MNANPGCAARAWALLFNRFAVRFLSFHTTKFEVCESYPPASPEEPKRIVRMQHFSQEGLVKWAFSLFESWPRAARSG